MPFLHLLNGTTVQAGTNCCSKHTAPVFPPPRCLLKWLEIRSVCPMCNKPILRLHSDAPQGAEGPMDPEEV